MCSPNYNPIYDVVLFFAEVLLFILVFVLVNRTIFKKDFFQKHKWVIWLINIIVPFVILYFISGIFFLKAC
jgi:hypothetical protein